MGLRIVCIDTVNTTMVVVLFMYLIYHILIQLQDLSPPMSEKAGKEFQYSFAPLRLPRRGLGRDT